MRRLEQHSAEALMRSALLLLASGGVVVTAIELAGARHWNSTVQIVPWAATGVVAIAVGLIAIRPNRPRILLARGTASLVLAAALFGVFMHLKSNYDAGPLDGQYGPRWESAATATRLWWAFSETVGPSPALAPLVLAQLALLTLLASLRHPAASRPSGSPGDTRTDRGD